MFLNYGNQKLLSILWNNDRVLTLYAINEMTSWINILFIHTYKANYIFLLVNCNLYSMSNYWLNINKRNELQNEDAQIGFATQVGMMLSDFEKFLKVYNSGMNQDMLNIAQGIEKAANSILDFIQDYLENSNKLLIDQIIYHAIYIYLCEKKEEFEKFHYENIEE